MPMRKIFITSRSSLPITSMANTGYSVVCVWGVCGGGVYCVLCGREGQGEQMVFSAKRLNQPIIICVFVNLHFVVILYTVLYVLSHFSATVCVKRGLLSILFSIEHSTFLAIYRARIDPIYRISVPTVQKKYQNYTSLQFRASATLLYTYNVHSPLLQPTL
jgi:hypothetical protein